MIKPRYEYTLGSARECRGWYFKVRHKMHKQTFDSWLELITELIKMLLYIVSNQKGSKIHEPEVTYLKNENPNSEIIEELDIDLIA